MPTYGTTSDGPDVETHASGFLFERSRAGVAPSFIFYRMAVMKLFLAAVGTSFLVQAAYSHMRPAEFEQSRFYRKKVSGCALLGVGMGIAGTGPSIVPAQLIVAKGAWWILIGCFVGALGFALPRYGTVLEERAGGSYIRWALLFGV
eukprot:gene37346-21911_t